MSFQSIFSAEPLVTIAAWKRFDTKMNTSVSFEVVITIKRKRAVITFKRSFGCRDSPMRRSMVSGGLIGLLLLLLLVMVVLLLLLLKSHRKRITGMRSLLF